MQEEDKSSATDIEEESPEDSGEKPVPQFYKVNEESP